MYLKACIRQVEGDIDQATVLWRETVVVARKMRCLFVEALACYELCKPSNVLGSRYSSITGAFPIYKRLKVLLRYLQIADGKKSHEYRQYARELHQLKAEHELQFELDPVEPEGDEDEDERPHPLFSQMPQIMAFFQGYQMLPTQNPRARNVSL